MALVGLPRCMVGRLGSSLRVGDPIADAMSLDGDFAFLASSGVWRFRVGRSGSSVDAVLVVVEAVSAVVSGLRRCMVGRLGSSAGGLSVEAVEVVVSPPEEVVSGVWRFMVGRSGSSVGVEAVSEVAGGLESEGSEPRRFMTGRLGSSLGDGVVVLEAEVSGLSVVGGVVWVVGWVAGGLVWS